MPERKPAGPQRGPGGLKGALTRKYGPLPAYAWVGLIVGGVLLYRHVTGGGAPAASSIAGSAPNAPSALTPVDTSGSGGSGGSPDLGSNPPPLPIGATPGGDTTVPQPQQPIIIDLGPAPSSAFVPPPAPSPPGSAGPGPGAAPGGGKQATSAPSPTRIAGALGYPPGAPVIVPYTITQGGRTVSSSLDVADIAAVSPQYRGLPQRPLSQTYAGARGPSASVTAGSVAATTARAGSGATGEVRPSGAGAVSAGTSKVNTQARRNAV